jgi:hypothetical protein
MTAQSPIPQSAKKNGELLNLHDVRKTMQSTAVSIAHPKTSHSAHASLCSTTEIDRQIRSQQCLKHSIHIMARSQGTISTLRSIEPDFPCNLSQSESLIHFCPFLNVIRDKMAMSLKNRTF